MNQRVWSNVSTGLFLCSSPRQSYLHPARRQGHIHEDPDTPGWEINLMGTGKPWVRVSVISTGKADAEAHLQAFALATRSGPDLTP